MQSMAFDQRAPCFGTWIAAELPTPCSPSKNQLRWMTITKSIQFQRTQKNQMVHVPLLFQFPTYGLKVQNDRCAENSASKYPELPKSPEMSIVGILRSSSFLGARRLRNGGVPGSKVMNSKLSSPHLYSRLNLLDLATIFRENSTQWVAYCERLFDKNLRES